MTQAVRWLPLGVPVDPDAGQARRWIVQELAKPEYRAAQPTWFDRLSAAVRDWLDSLTLRTDGVSQGPILAIAAVLVLAALVAAFLIFGLPRINRRSGVTGGLFGEDDDRDAAAMRRSAQLAAGHGDWATAIEEMFRAIARGLAERTILSTSPGTTARDFATRAGAAFPERAERLSEAATTFDAVRYLGGSGTEADYLALTVLEDELRASRPPLAVLA
ncbi:MAG: rane protein [Microbacteriaceae bacterium]|nr:rane protein [Microbacteriaceae bacterium]